MQWNIEAARTVYNVSHWSDGYFDINQQGCLEAFPSRNRSLPGIDMHRLAHEVREQGLSWPVLVRFSDILHDRVDTLCNAFAKAMFKNGYDGGYTAVYPIKVNQQRTVVEEIRSHGSDRVGLEAGSKPELLAVLGMASPGGVIVCNGYKDREYIRLALIGLQMGHRVYLVIEKLSEVDLILQESSKLGIEPLLGVRVRLSSIGAGKWQNSGGEKAKFGLTAGQVLEALEQLTQAGKLDSLQLLHFHLGSQLANIRDIQKGMREAARYYVELLRLGANIQCFDVGGGLGVDYEGSRSRNFCSMNYSVLEYATKIVHTLKDVCDAHDLPHPMIISESGRALTAHHAVLITNVVDHDVVPNDEPQASHSNEAQVIQDLWQVLQTVSNRSVIETYHDAVHWLSEAQDMYTHGLLNLAERARAEQIYFATCIRVRDLLDVQRRPHRELLDELNEKLADKYFCNFSLFQSMPDVWGIGQVFPIMPLQRLDEAPTQRVVIQDMTCDSDGRIDQYVENEGIEATLPLHAVRAGEDYLIGTFMVGAYQEILGDLHNLFGDTDSVDVELDGQGGYRLTGHEHGDTVDELLRYVHFEPDDLVHAYEQKMAGAPISDEQRQHYLYELSEGLKGYTYLEK